jgi:hypothetical protein
MLIILFAVSGWIWWHGETQCADVDDDSDYYHEDET